MRDPGGPPEREEQLADRAPGAAERRGFRRDVLAAIERDDRAAAPDLHEQTEMLVGLVVSLNERLNRSFEARSEEAAARGEDPRGSSRATPRSPDVRSPRRVDARRPAAAEPGA